MKASIFSEKFPKEGEHSDEDLAAITGINLNSVRHTLYTLYENGSPNTTRIKNNETGWLTYLWQLRIDHIADDAMREDMDVVLDKLHRVQFEEENDFYICKDCHVFSPLRRPWAATSSARTASSHSLISITRCS